MLLPTSACPKLRILAINDVYSLEQLPRLANLVRHHRTHDPADKLIVTLAGDFVAPSVLSSLDSGRGMVDCMNAVGIDYFILGNHEDDIATEELHGRINEMNAVGLGTNLGDFDPKMLRSVTFEVGAPNKRSVRVGVVGVVLTDEKIYRRPPFGGIALNSAQEAALLETKRLMEVEGCVSVLPLTHQTLDDDRALVLAQGRPPFPVVLGGHEHEVTLKQFEGTWIVKAGSDAVHAVVIDLVWPEHAPKEGGAELPDVTVRLDDCSQYAEDPDLRVRVDAHMSRVRDLEGATLAFLAPGEVLSSVGTRVRQTSMGSLLCSRLREAHAADVCLVNGGGIRGSREYKGEVTYGDLKGEVPFDNELSLVEMPGTVVQEAIRASRSKAPASSGGFLQVDDGVVLDANENILSIAGAPFDPLASYRVVLVRNLLFGLDHVEPLERFGREHADRIPAAGSGHEIKVALVNAFARELWRHLGSFEDLDTNRDNVVTPSEIELAIARANKKAPSKVAADLVLRAIDIDKDGMVSPADVEAVFRPKPRQ
ncbi:MAG: 5'-nucleotidase C-terminal domain-containing protein [Polyangiaceae bacterium]|nr:5'-nucleotidase C-terminal domain-containing protein [Polyangiaceae bacterium]